jgi:beta-lactamase regulating signal transducer with metallopeptidase domain
MIAFIIKSTFSLLVIYLFYIIFLAKDNMPRFNRFYLLGGNVFSIIISLVVIRINVPITPVLTSVTINYQIDTKITHLEITIPQTNHSFSILWIFYAVYIVIALLLLIRFTINILRLVKMQHNNPKIVQDGFKIVLVKNQTLPFSFMTSVFVDEAMYKNSSITKELLLHEFAHIKQNHSLDIIFIEILQVLFWFNPLIWLYKKAIQLNHEYLADHAVVDSDIRIQRYQDLLMQTVSGNNSSYLVSISIIH